MKIKKIKKVKVSEKSLVYLAIVTLAFSSSYLISYKQDIKNSNNAKKNESTIDKEEENLGELYITQNENIIHFQFANDLKTAEQENATIAQEQHISHAQYLVNNGVFLVGTSVAHKKDATVAANMYDLVDDKADFRPRFNNFSEYTAGTVFMNDQGDLRIAYNDEDAYQLLICGYNLVGYQVNNNYSTELNDAEGFYQDEYLACTEGLDLSLKR